MSLDSFADSEAISAERAALAPVEAAPVDAVRPIAPVRAASRLASIDILRGLVIVLMALDHVRDYFTGVRFDPLDLTQTTPELFLTRWVTHFCAPIFIFLAGVSARLVGQRSTRAGLSRFLFTRGLWLVVLEFTVVNYAWTFSFSYPIGLFLQVIWAIGISMVILAALVRLDVRWVGALAVAVIAGHNLLDGIAPADLGPLALLWNLVHVPAQAPFGLIFYPIVPWVGIMALGYALGGIFLLEGQRRRRILAGTGFAFLAAFIAIRYLNGYGDPQPWTAQATLLHTVFSFIDVEKYPPSLLYALMTLGPAMLLLALFDSVRARWAAVLEIFGRVPLFVYVLHIVAAHLLAGLLAYATGFGTSVLRNFVFAFPAQWGYGLVGVYVAWIAVMVLLYPLCKWFAGVKRRRRDWWLSYL